MMPLPSCQAASEHHLTTGSLATCQPLRAEWIPCAGASFLSSLFNRQATTTTTTPPTPQLTPAQRAKLAERSIRERAAAELGPPPAAPVAPKGIYLHGSVGSGKTMLMVGTED
jgi:predicted ATPase